MNNSLIYEQKIIKYSREELIKLVKKAVSTSRFEHILRVETMALRLAESYQVNLEKASIAALVHDYAKERNDQDFIDEIMSKKLDPKLLNANNAIWHGVVGAELIKDELAVWDEDILNAVRHHTTGSPKMSMLEQIIFMADYIEEGRNFNGVAEARQLTFNNLQDGVRFQIKQTIQYLIERNKNVYPSAIDTYNAWVAK